MFRCWFVCLLLISCCSEAHEMVSLARDYRKDTTLPAKQEELREKNIVEQLFSSLKKYDEQSSLEKAVCQFFMDEELLINGDYTVIDAKLTDTFGKSRDTVFFIRDSFGRLCYVVKAFKTPRDLSSKFLPEISALDVIEQLAIPNVVPIKPLAVASYSNQEGEWGLLLETAATGQRIDQFIYRLGNLKPDSEEREAFLEVCQKVFRRMAESFAGLHAQKSSTPFSISKSDLANYHNKLFILVTNQFILQEVGKHCSLYDFFQYVEEIKEDALDVPVFYSYWHGDAHLGNLLYDEVVDAFYFIDVAKLHYSVSITGEPLLDGIMDLVRVEENLRRKAMGLLTENEVGRLMQSFYDTYEQSSNQKIVQPLLLFHRTMKKLGRLTTYARYIEEEDPATRSIDQAIFDHALKYFENQIKIYSQCPHPH